MKLVPKGWALLHSCSNPVGRSTKNPHDLQLYRLPRHSPCSDAKPFPARSPGIKLLRAHFKISSFLKTNSGMCKTRRAWFTPDTASDLANRAPGLQQGSTEVKAKLTQMRNNFSTGRLDQPLEQRTEADQGFGISQCLPHKQDNSGSPDQTWVIQPNPEQL